MLPIKVMRKGGAGGGDTISIPSGTYANYVLDPNDAFVGLTFNSSGACTVSANTDPATAPNWKVGAGVGADYDISFDGGSSWLNLASSRQISQSRTTFGTTSVSYPVRIRRASDLVQVATGTVTLEATVDA